MCSITDKIKLCTCSGNPRENGKSYWVLHRYNPNKNMDVVGEIVLELSALNPNFESNKKLLLQALNHGHPFDTDLKFREKDVLELHFKGEDQEETYGFSYHNSQWEYEEFHPLELMNEFDEIEKGVVERFKGGV